MQPHRRQPTGLLCPQDSPGKNTGVGLSFPTPVHTCRLSCFSRVRLCATLWTAAHQAPLFTWFSRQGYWGGLPCPPPQVLPNSGIEPQSPALKADSLPKEPPRKPKNTGVGSSSLLQGIFQTQGLNSDLPHCRQIFYCLNHQGKFLGIYFINIYFHFSHPILLPCNKFSIIYGFQS